MSGTRHAIEHLNRLEGRYEGKGFFSYITYKSRNEFWGQSYYLQIYNLLTIYLQFTYNLLTIYLQFTYNLLTIYLQIYSYIQSRRSSRLERL
jgi:hypothetical protein